MTKTEGGGIDGNGLVAKVLMKLTIASLLPRSFVSFRNNFFTPTWMCYKALPFMCIMRKWLQQTRPQAFSCSLSAFGILSLSQIMMLVYCTRCIRPFWLCVSTSYSVSFCLSKTLTFLLNHTLSIVPRGNLVFSRLLRILIGYCTYWVEINRVVASKQWLPFPLSLVSKWHIFLPSLLRVHG